MDIKKAFTKSCKQTFEWMASTNPLQFF